MKIKKILPLMLFIVILGTALFVRLYKLNQIPSGVYVDEASLGYNAYSILMTGKDEYGKSWPIYFRAFATFQDSLYGYFSIIPIYLLGLNILSTRLVSVISGLVVVLITFLLFYFSNLKNKLSLALFAGLTVAFAPWAIYQSRVAVGSNLGLALTAISILFLLLSLKKRSFFILACTIFGIASYAYAGQRITGILFPVVFVIINRKIFWESKKLIVIGFSLLILTMLPQFIELLHAGSLVRYQTQGYTQESTFLKNGDSLTKLPIFVGWPLYIARQFTSQYLSDFSPRSLFFEPEPQLVRSIPDLSVFYIWMIIPFFAGFVWLWKQKSDPLVQIIFLLIIIGPLPEALTGDPFYTLRMLPSIWGVTLMIALGIKFLFDKFKHNYLKILTAILLITFSAFDFYICYFVLLKYERSSYFGYPFQVLAQITEENKNQTYVMNNPRPYGRGFI